MPTDVYWTSSNATTTFTNYIAIGTSAATLAYWPIINTTYSTYIPVRWTVPTVFAWPTETEAQREARDAASRERQREWEEAAARARQLLDGSLDEEQRADWRQHRRFRVLSADGERTYEIRDSGQVQNVHRVDEHGKSVRRYCIHPTEPVPDADAYLAQKLWIETDEEAFLRVANAS